MLANISGVDLVALSVWKADGHLVVLYSVGMVRYLVLKMETVLDCLARFPRDWRQALEPIVTSLSIILATQRHLRNVVGREIDVRRKIHFVLPILEASTGRAEIVGTDGLGMLRPSIGLAELVVHEFLLPAVHNAFVVSG